MLGHGPDSRLGDVNGNRNTSMAALEFGPSMALHSWKGEDRRGRFAESRPWLCSGVYLVLLEGCRFLKKQTRHVHLVQATPFVPRNIYEPSQAGHRDESHWIMGFPGGSVVDGRLHAELREHQPYVSLPQLHGLPRRTPRSRNGATSNESPWVTYV